MKSRIVEKETFKPITIEITIESKEEQQSLYNIFNHLSILNSTSCNEDTFERFKSDTGGYNTKSFDLFVKKLKEKF